MISLATTGSYWIASLKGHILSALFIILTQHNINHIVSQLSGISINIKQMILVDLIYHFCQSHLGIWMGQVDRKIEEWILIALKQKVCLHPSYGEMKLNVKNKGSFQEPFRDERW